MPVYTIDLPNGMVADVDAGSEDEALAQIPALLGQLESTPAPAPAPVPAPAPAPAPAPVPGMPPVKEQVRMPMGTMEAMTQGAINQFTMNWGDEALRAMGAVETGDRLESEFKRAQKEAPVGTFIGQLMGGLASGYPLVKGAQYIGLGGGAIRNMFGAAATGAVESAASSAGQAQPGEKTEDLGSAAAWGAGLGAGAYPLSALASKGLGFAAKAIPGVREQFRQEQAYQKIGAAARASGVDPAKLQLELGQLGEAGVLADLNYPRLKGITEQALEAPKVPLKDIQEQMTQRRQALPERVGAEFESRIQGPSLSVIDDARATGLTDYDVPFAEFGSLHDLSSNIRKKAQDQLNKSFVERVDIVNTQPKKVYRDVYTAPGTLEFLEDNPLGQEAAKRAITAVKIKHGKAARAGRKGKYSLEFLHNVSLQLDRITENARASKNPAYESILAQKDLFQKNLRESARLDPLAGPAGVSQYQDAMAGFDLADKLDNALSFGRTLATGSTPVDLRGVSDQIRSMNPMERNAATVSFMDGLLRNAKSMKPSSSLEAAFRVTDAHRNIFNELSGDPAAAGMAFDNIADIVRREKAFNETAKITGLGPLEVAQTASERMRSSTARMAVIPTIANATTFALNVMNHVVSRKMNPKVARNILSTMFNKDIDDATWKAIERGFGKSGYLTKMKKTLAQNMAGFTGGVAGPEENNPTATVPLRSAVEDLLP